MDQPALDLPDANRSKWVLNLADLRAELQKRHGVRISHDDPALMVVTALEVVAQKLCAKFEQAVERSNDDVSALMAQHVESAKGVGVGLVDAAAQYQAKQMREVVEKLAPAVVDEARTLLQGLAVEIARGREGILQAERRAWTAAAVAGGVLALTVGLILGHVL